MYITEFNLKNIKCFEEVAITFPHQKGNYGGWNVLLGGNGTGKSTLLQAIALVLVGPLTGQRLLFNLSGWARQGTKRGEVRGQIIQGEHDVAAGQPRKKPYQAAFVVTGNEPVEIDEETYDSPQLVQVSEDQKGLAKGPYAANRPGWLACGYGPFRRLTGMGGSEEYDLVYGSGRGRRFATLFREGAALTNSTEWLVGLYSHSYDPNQPDKDKINRDLEILICVINGLLPGGVKIEKVDSRNVFFRTIGESTVTVPDLSDGYRSFLALAIDLLRHIYESVGDFAGLVKEEDGRLSVTMEGVVLIDEVDAHLHPCWQREIGFRLGRTFPKIQFIVTSHSPFVAQAASNHGIFILRQPASEKAVGVISFPESSIRGWRADQILTHRLLFNMEGTRDEETEQLLKEHAELVARREWADLPAEEKLRLVNIEEQLSQRLTGPGEGIDELKRQATMQEYVEKTLVRLRSDS